MPFLAPLTKAARFDQFSVGREIGVIEDLICPYFDPGGGEPFSEPIRRGGTVHHTTKRGEFLRGERIFYGYHRPLGGRIISG